MNSMVAAQDPTGELYRSLYLSARSVLEGEKPPVPEKVTAADLEEILKRVTEQKFFESFGYRYDGQNTKPSDRDVHGLLTAIEDFIINPNSAIAPIKKFVNINIFGPTGLSQWVPARKAKGDLLATTVNTVQITTMNAWEFQGFNKLYDGPNGENPISAKAIISFANARSDDGSVVDSIMYFCGVYYNSSGGWD